MRRFEAFLHSSYVSKDSVFHHAFHWLTTFTSIAIGLYGRVIVRNGQEIPCHFVTPLV